MEAKLIQLIIIMIASFLIILLLDIIKEKKEFEEVINEIFTFSLKHTPLTFLFLWILIPVIEELIFRSQLFLWFNELNNTAWIYIILSGCLFGLLHLPKIQYFLTPGNLRENFYDSPLMPKSKKGNVTKFITTSFTGIFLGYVAVNKQSIILPIILRIGINTIILLGAIVYSYSIYIEKCCKDEWENKDFLGEFDSYEKFKKEYMKTLTGKTK